MRRAGSVVSFVRIIAVVAVALAPATVAATAGAAVPAAPLGAVAAAYAAPTRASGTVSLDVRSARDVNPARKAIKPNAGDAVTAYQWIINADDTGDPGTAKDPLLSSCLPATAQGTHSNDPDFADTCPWPSTRATSGFAPIIAEGDQSDFAGKTLTLPGGKYLVSVKARGYKIDGAHFTVDGGTQTVPVGLNPTPLPLATIQLQVYDDYAPVDGTFEVDAESSVDMSGFHAHLSDVFGTVSVDYYGNALCTSYQHTTKNPNSPIVFDAANKPVVDTTKAPGCISDRKGVIKIPNLGPNRYAATVAAPALAGGRWVQTTTLEGGHDHDIWVQEGDTGLDTEQLRGQEPVPATQFGFTKTMALAPSATDTTRPGGIKGVVVQGLPYIGGQNGVVGPEGVAGVKIGSRLKNVWVALSDLNNGDQQVYLAQAAADGTFRIDDVADGSYQVTLWDDDQDYIIMSFNAEVDAAAHSGSGGYTEVGQQMLVGWFSHFSGHVFVDDNGNGIRDPGENGVPNFALTLRERDNTPMDQATNTVTTNDQGEYDIREGYPMAKYLILEAFNTRYATTGVTWKGDNDPEGTTQLGSMVDLNVLPIIGLHGTVDWGVRPYAQNENGGIAATVSYDTTRNELDAADSASEAYQPGIPGVKVHLYASTPCRVTDTTSATYTFHVTNECRQGKEIVPLQVKDATNAYVDNPAADRGAFVKGPEQSDAYTSETWGAPRGCTARQWDGSILDSTIQQALPEFGVTADHACVESPMMGFQAGVNDTAGAQSVNGNYGFSGMDPGDYIVSVEIPRTPVGDKPMYKVTSEEDVNVFTGDTYLPQENFPPSTQAAADNPAGAPDRSPTPPSQPPSQQAGIISSCVGPLHRVHVRSVPDGDTSDPIPGTYNPDFNAGGGSPFEGYEMPSCQDKLVTVRSGQTVAPNFNLFTEVPIPTHFWGLTINDLGLTLDTRSIGYGEAQGLPNVPVGFYDWAGRLDYTAHTDFNGMYEALMPSTDTYNCPVPAGPCPNMYRTVGNDPGAPGALNADYNSRFRTIAANFQGWPGLYTVTDQAPTQAASTVATPDGAVANSTICELPATTPQLLAVDTPYVKGTNGANRTVTMTGYGFGATRGTLTLNDPLVTTMPAVPAVVTSWTDHQIVFTVPTTYTNTKNAKTNLNGVLQLSLRNAAGVTAYNTLSVLALSGKGDGTSNSQNNAKLFEVGPGKTYATVQAALNAARPTNDVQYDAVVVWPNTQTAINPQGDYNENVVVHNQTRIQGVGPGGFDDAGTFVRGSILDGTGFDLDLPSGTSWLAAVNRQGYRGLAAVPDAADVTVLAPLNGTHQPPATGSPGSVWPVTLDGLRIRNGSQANIGGAVNAITGAVSTPVGAGGSLVTQGGGVYVHQQVQGVHLTNNVFDGDSGSFGGAIRIGTPYVGNNHNESPVISHNQIRDNGGTNLAGGIGLFTGSDGYSVDHNAICGNHSSEYGGALTAFGYQNATPALGAKNTIDHNRIWFNQSYDEGGAIMVAGELPADPNGISEGTGPVSIDSNVIQANLANDDGGGIRLLQTSGSHVATPGCTTNKRTGVTTCPANRVVTDTIGITNNQIADNVSAHEGGGIALDDAAFVTIVDDTIVRNITTASATTSNGQPAPAGLSTGTLSDQLLAQLKSQPGFATMLTGGTAAATPTMLDDAFSDNYAGTYYAGLETGITDADANRWDFGIADNPQGLQLPISSSWYQNAPDATGSGNVVGNDAVNDVPVKSDFAISVNILASRQFPMFRQAAIVTTVLPYSLLGDFDLAAGSSAIGIGSSRTTAAYGNDPAFVTQGVPTPVYVTAPPFDIHGVARPTGTRYDAGAAQATS
ncbi:SdrD B-like domain-containing protein [Phycicoccus duodecadis]|uniref:SdrD B-like protein n=1 Tax=Phycicoccus duodecadis TaxID=173053 RepID=A0A2N3YF37_9MICO|nr:SdrD B-like domain-containing protein [Phycicoccus duodecadis]PKW25472.1 SdrD B-like protein [Phycicoccus duodecadis]